MNGSPKVALLSGCSSGFGLLAAIELARAGLRVFATMRDVRKRANLDASANTAGVSVEVIALDVTQQASIDQAVAEVEQRAGAIDVLVNNAGYGIGGFVEELSLAEIREQFETNFFGTVALTKAVLPGMRRRGGGRIVNVSSIGGRVAVPGLAAYCSSKFAVEGFTESLRYEALGDGIFVSLVEPGTYKTPIFEANRRVAAAADRPDAPHYQVMKRLEAEVDKLVARSTQDPHDVARTIARVATAKRPRLRYLVGKDARAQALAKRLLPDGAIEAAMVRITGLGR